MVQYWHVLKPLSYQGGVLPAGAIARLDLPDRNLQILQEKTAIAPWRLPPLDQVPGFKWRARRCGLKGVDTGSLLGSDVGDLAERLGIPAALVARWQSELRDNLQAPSQPARAKG